MPHNTPASEMPMLKFMPGAKNKPKVSKHAYGSKKKMKRKHNPGSHNPY